MTTCKNISTCDWWWCKDIGKCLLSEFEQRKPVPKSLRVIRSGLSKYTGKKQRRALGLTKKNTINQGNGFSYLGKLNEKRKSVFEKNGYKCVKCGSSELLTIDHIIPISKGGGNKKSNLQTMCYPCNGKKGNKMEEIEDYKKDEFGVRIEPVKEKHIPQSKSVIKNPLRSKNI